MQDEVNNETIALAIKGGKVTAETLEKALKNLLQEIEKSKQTHSQPKILSQYVLKIGKNLRYETFWRWGQGNFIIRLKSGFM